MRTATNRTGYRHATSRLTVRVLAYDVPVVLVPRLADGTGRPAYGVCEWDHRRILLSAETPRHLRLNVLCHEVWHAHRFEVGRPDGIEAECDLFAMAAEAVVNAVDAHVVSDDGNRPLAGLAWWVRVRRGDAVPVRVRLTGPISWSDGFHPCRPAGAVRPVRVAGNHSTRGPAAPLPTE